MSPIRKITTAELELALITIVQIAFGHSHPVIGITTHTHGATVFYTAVIPPRYRPAVYRYLSRYSAFRLLQNYDEALILTPENAAEVLRLSYERAQIAAALE